MNKRFWMRKALSMCLTIAVIAAYSTVVFASFDKAVGEISVRGIAAGEQTMVVKINGENAQSGRSFFSGSVVATPQNASAVVNLGKAGAIELSPNTTMQLSFDEKNIVGELTSGRITVLDSLNKITVKTSDGKTIELNEGESANSTGAGAQTDNDDNTGKLITYAVILGGAVAGIIYAASSDNKVLLGGGSTIVSSTR